MFTSTVLSKIFRIIVLLSQLSVPLNFIVCLSTTKEDTNSPLSSIEFIVKLKSNWPKPPPVPYPDPTKISPCLVMVKSNSKLLST